MLRNKWKYYGKDPNNITLEVNSFPSLKKLKLKKKFRTYSRLDLDRFQERDLICNIISPDENISFIIAIYNLCYSKCQILIKDHRIDQ